MPRQAQHWRRPQPAGHQRLARSHRHLVEVEAEAQFARGAAEQVVIPHGGAAGGDDQVGALRQRQRRRDRVEPVAGDGQQPRQGAGGLGQRRQPEAVRGDDLVGARGFPGHHQLVPGGQDRDRRPAGHRDLGNVHRRQQRQVRRAQPARRRHPVACAEVAAQGHDVSGGVQRVRQPDPVAVADRVLLDHHAVGAVRQRCAGEDPHRLPGRDGAKEAMPGNGLADDPELGAGAHLGVADGIAVHR